MLPLALDEMEPGLDLAAVLGNLEVEDLSGHNRVVVLRAHQRMASHYQAQVYEAMAAIAGVMAGFDPDPAMVFEGAAAEIRAALCLTRRAADSELELAIDLKERLPQVWEALAAGLIDRPRVRVIVTGTSHLEEETAREVVDQVIDRAARLTTGQLRALLRRLCIQADPDEAAQRYDDAIEGRRIYTEATVEGTSTFYGLNLAPDRVAAAMERINHLAQQLRGGDETRPIDQIRADVFLDLLEGHSTARGRKGVVDIHVDLTTLTRLAEDPGELAGYGPVIADIARQVAEQQHERAEWRFTVTENGQVVHNGITRRRPNVEQSRHVQARNQTCIFPGCRMPAVDCDLDHRIPWSQGGPTTTEQLVPACRHDHGIRHRHGWTHCQLPNGDHQWTSRLGHTYTTSGLPP